MSRDRQDRDKLSPLLAEDDRVTRPKCHPWTRRTEWGTDSIYKHGLSDADAETLRTQAAYLLPKRLLSPSKPPSTNAKHLDLCRLLRASTHLLPISSGFCPVLVPVGACEPLDKPIQSP